MAEGKVRCGLAGGVEPVGVGERVRVVVGGAVVEQDQVPGPDPGAADLEVFAGVAGDPATALARRPQQFLHRGGDQGGIVSQGLPLPRMGEQHQRAHADRSDRRLVPGEQHEHGQHRDLVLVGPAGSP